MRRASGTKYTIDPPVLAAEIVSEDDRAVEIPQKLAEYHDWGVRHRPGCALGRSRSENEPVAYKILFTEDALLL
jgi:hypothetical protein